MNSGRFVGLKWPNDIVFAGGDLSGKKVGGMLSSSVGASNGGSAGVVVGLGCNVSWPPPGFSGLPEAGALHHQSGAPVSVESLGACLIERFDRELESVEHLGGDHLLSRYRDRCVTIGQEVRVEMAGEQLVGRATDLDTSGALLVEVEGRQHIVAVGDVVHLRPST